MQSYPHLLLRLHEPLLLLLRLHEPLLLLLLLRLHEPLLLEVEELLLGLGLLLLREHRGHAQISEAPVQWLRLLQPLPLLHGRTCLGSRVVCGAAAILKELTSLFQPPRNLVVVEGLQKAAKHGFHEEAASGV